MASSININQNNNDITLQDNNRSISITDNNSGTTINVTQPVTNVVTVATPGPQGPQGPIGPIPTSGSFTGSFSGSFQGDGSGLTNISASNIVGLNLSQIAVGNVSASVSTGTGSFQITSGSSTFMFISSSGNIGIGTSLPTSPLTVIGSSQFGNATGAGSVEVFDGYYSYTFGKSTSIYNPNNNYTRIWMSSSETKTDNFSGNFIWRSAARTIFGLSDGAVNFYNQSNTVVAKFNSSTGNFLIGTTTDSGYKLDVNGPGNFEGNVRLGVGLQLLFNNNNVGIYRDSNTLRLGGFGGVEILSSNTNISAQTIRLKVFDTGNVTIGTTIDSGYKLDVNGTARIQTSLVLNGSSALLSSTLTAYQSGANRVFSLASSTTKTDATTRILFSLNSSESINQQALDFQFNGASSIGNRYFSLQTSESGIAYGGGFAMQKDGGWVGIGTSTNAGYTLNVSGSTNITGNLTVTGSATLTGALTASNATISGNVTVLGTASINTLVVNQTQLSTGSNQLGDAADDFQTLYGTVRIPTGSLTVTGSITQNASTASFGGLVGIGTTTPSSALQIVGSTNVEGLLNITNNTSLNYANAVNILFPNTVNGNQVAGFYIGKALSSKNGWGVNYIHSSDGSNSNRGSIAFYGVDNILNWFASGNVTINSTTDAGYKLDVNGTARVQSFLDVYAGSGVVAGANNPMVVNSNTWSQGSGFVLASRNTSDSSPRLTLRANSAGACELQLYNNGNKSYIRQVNLSGVGNASIYLFQLDNRAAKFAVTPDDSTTDASFFGKAIWDGGSAATFRASSATQTANIINVQNHDGTSTFLNVKPTGNVLINTTTDVASSKLTIESTTQGLLPPRTNLTSNISSPAQGLMTYVTASATEGLYYYNSGSYQGWTRLLNETGSQAISGSLTITGSIFDLGNSRFAAAGGTSTLSSNALTSAAAIFYQNGFNGVVALGGYSNGGGEIQSYQNGGASLGGALYLQRQAGDVLIGTTTGLARFQVKGSGATSSTTAFRVENSNASASLTVLDNGNVGIGTAAPAYSLDVNGRGRFTNGIESAQSGYTGFINNGLNSSMGYNISPETNLTVLKIGFATGTSVATLLKLDNSTNISAAGQATVPLDILANPSQTANLLQWRNSGGTVLGAINATGRVAIGRTSATASLDVAGTTRISGSFNTAISGSILTIQGSGSTQPILDIQGSQGQLFSVIDALSGSLMSVNDVSGLPILEVFSDDRVVMGTYGAPALIVTGSNTIISGSLRGRVVTLSTASATASMDCSLSNFFDLTLSGSMYLGVSNIQPGETINLRITQPATSGSLNYTSSIKFPNGLPYSASATSSVVDLISFISFDSSTLYATSLKNLI